jgi:hypothetical protein
MALGNIFDTLKEAAGGLLGGLGDMATTAVESAGLGDVVQQATDVLGGASGAAGDIAAQAGDALGGVTDQASGALAGITDKLTGGGK